jgi:hypothetical protein
MTLQKGIYPSCPSVHPGHQSITHTSEERKSNTQCIIKTIPWNYTALKLDWYSTDCKHKMDLTRIITCCV